MRLTRMGRKKRPYYRVVVTEHTAPRNGAFLEILGHYDPLATDSELVVKSDRVKHWLEQGAQPTKTVHHLLAAKNLIEPWKAKPRSKRADEKRAAQENKTETDATSQDPGDSTTETDPDVSNEASEKS